MSNRSSYGSGSLRETADGSGVWRYRWRDAEGQHMTTFGSKSAPLTKKQAERAIRNGPPPAAAAAPVRKASGRTFGDVLDEWLKYGRSSHGKVWSPRYADEARAQIEARIRPTLGHLAVADLRAADIERACEVWGESVSDSSVHRFGMLVKSALEFAYRRDYVVANPADKAVIPAQTKSPTKVPTRDEVKALIKAAAGINADIHSAVALAAITGARAGEIAALKWSDVNLRKGEVRITKSVCEVGGQIITKTTKTGEERCVKITNGNLETLRKVLKPGKSTEHVIGGGSSPVDPATLSDDFVSVRGAAHIRGVSFRSLRSYYATALLSSGVPVHVVAELGGWKSTRMVLDVYGRSTRSGHDAAADIEMV